MKYIVKKHHHRETYRNGDKEDETVVTEIKSFDSKETAESFVEHKLLDGSKQGYKIRKNKDTDSYYIYTDHYWTNENTGDTYQETFMYKISKL